jgi:lysophospholipase L1-like esterase
MRASRPLLLALICLTPLLPVAVNAHLRKTYADTLLYWSAKVKSPDWVFIGDSITAGGGDFGSFDAINLANPGTTSQTVAETLANAEALHPRHIFAMAGVNDIRLGIPQQRTLAAWQKMMADPRVVVTLLPPTADPNLNKSVASLNAQLARMAARRNRQVISIGNLASPQGTIEPRYTTDGLHLTSAAYEQWKAELKRFR